MQDKRMATSLLLTREVGGVAVTGVAPERAAVLSASAAVEARVELTDTDTLRADETWHTSHTLYSILLLDNKYL